MIEAIKSIQNDYLASRPVELRRETGQYFTGRAVADYMASMLHPVNAGCVRILDAGAGAGILHAKPNIHWKKDRGKEPARDQAQVPWFWKDSKFTGERVNDVHLGNDGKRKARERAEGGQP